MHAPMADLRRLLSMDGTDLLPAFLAALAVILALYFRFRFRFRTRLPPGPRPWPIVGNHYHVKPVRFRCFAEWAQTYGPIMSVWFGTSLTVVVCSSELAREVLKDKDQHLSDRHRSRLFARSSLNGADLIWADYGPHYVKVRKVSNLELFSPKRLEALRPIREDEVTSMVESIFHVCTREDKIGQAQALVLKEHLHPVALNNVTRLAFGKRFVKADGSIDEQGVEFKTIVAGGHKFGASVSLAEYVPWLRWMFPLEEEAYEEHYGRRDNLIKIIMEEHTQARYKTSGAKDHFVDALLTLKDQYDFSEDTIIALLWDMITAGVLTTVASAEWAMSEMVRNPRIQDKLQEELDRVVGLERVVNETDFANLPYLQCVVKESFRLHPPTPLMLPHKASAKVKIGGYDIPKGTNILVNVWAIARDPKIWENPLEFRPERFLEEDIDIRGHDMRVLPFGAGRRVCPGAQLGIHLVTSMLAHLLHHFKWALEEGGKPEDVDMRETPGLVAFMHTPLRVVARPRLPSHLYARVPAEI